MKTENLVVVTLLVGSFFLVKDKFGNPSPGGGDYRKDKRESKKRGETQSYIDLQYQNFAVVLWDSIKGWFYQDSKTKAAKILMQMKNNLDLVKLEEAYGKAKIKDSLNPFFPNAQKTLMQAVSDEFDWPFSYLKDNVNADWRQKGILQQIP